MDAEFNKVQLQLPFMHVLRHACTAVARCTYHKRAAVVAGLVQLLNAVVLGCLPRALFVTSYGCCRTSSLVMVLSQLSTSWKRAFTPHTLGATSGFCVGLVAAVLLASFTTCDKPLEPVLLDVFAAIDAQDNTLPSAPYAWANPGPHTVVCGVIPGGGLVDLPHDAECVDSNARVWRVRCPNCSVHSRTCDWPTAWTDRCDGAPSFIRPDGAHPALADCLRDHFVTVLGDCTVRSLVARALDAADGLASPPTSAALPLITLGHHLLQLRATPYGQSAHRVSYRYYPEPLEWNNWRRRLTIAEELSTLLDVWRPAADYFGMPGRAVFLFGGTYWLNRSAVDDFAAWLGGGCNASLSGCPWHHHVGMRNDIVAPTPLVIIKGRAPPFNRTPSAVEIAEQRELAGHVRSLGFRWLDVYNLTTALPMEARGDGVHFDVYNSSHRGGRRAGGMLTLAITNLFLDAMCGAVAS